MLDDLAVPETAAVPVGGAAMAERHLPDDPRQPIELPDAPRVRVGERTEVYSSPWVSLHLHEVTPPSGRTYRHHVVSVPFLSVGVVVHHREHGVLLAVRHRFATGTVGLEVPAGHVEDGETPEEAARREVREETGWSLGSVRPLIECSPSDGVSSQRFALLYAEAGERLGAPTDLDEATPLVWLPTGRIDDAVRGGLVPGCFSLAALLCARSAGLLGAES